MGQPRSTIDFRQLITERKIVIFNLNAFDVGEEVAALIGGTLLNLAARAISAQSTLPPDQRQPVTVIVDEFHTLPGADYEQVFGELAKYGANMILATQTLTRLERLTDAQRMRDLRATVFSNLDGLFAFHTSAEDAYLAPELGGGLDAQDLLELGHFQCYARLTDARTGERLPTFSVQLDPPPEGDSAFAAMLARYSAERYGRDALDVELDLQAALERIRGPRHATADEDAALGAPESAVPNNGVPAPDGVIASHKVLATMTGDAGRVFRAGCASKRILQVLACCERAPTGLVAQVIGRRHAGPTRQVLARLRKARLIRAESAQPSHLTGNRVVRLWSLTPAGSAFVSARGLLASPPSEKEFPLIRANRNATLQSADSLVLTYSALDSFLGTLKSRFCLRKWEAPFVRSLSSPSACGTWHVRIAAAAGLEIGNNGTKITALLLVDPGTSRVVSFRQLVRRLYALRRSVASTLDPDQSLLVIATPDGEATQPRCDAWRELVQQTARQLDEQPIRTQFVSWHGRCQPAASAESKHRKRRLAIRPRQIDSALALLARHPLLTRKQLASLLCASPARVSRVQRRMIDRGWRESIAAQVDHPAFVNRLGLTELTLRGQREATTRLVLFRQSSVRNGFVERRPGVHRRLLRNLGQTVGVNEFFVTLVEVAREFARKGGDDALEEWRSAAACARGYFAQTVTAAIAVAMRGTGSFSNMTVVPNGLLNMRRNSQRITATEIGGPHVWNSKVSQCSCS